MPPPPQPRSAVSAQAAHFRAHPRRSVRIEVELQLGRARLSSRATVVDISLAGAGLEIDEPLVAGERLSVAISTPTLWDPLVVPAVVAWARAGEGRARARAGVAFEHESPESVFATWEMLSALVFD